MTFRPAYAGAALLVLAIELAIAVFVDDRFVRPYLGDSLAVILVYLAIRGGTPLGMARAALAALTVAFAIEFGQYFHLIRILGLEDDFVARCLLGTGFDPRDFVAYTAGAAAALIGDDLIRREMLLV